jgi:formylglycine-generating enzyme required for sulfatase activity
MLVALKLKVAIAAGLLSGPMVATILAPATTRTSHELVDITPASFTYRMAGDFSRAGRPVEGPLRTERLTERLSIMSHQVTAADYGRCVDAGDCPKIAVLAGGEDKPMVGVSWHDATAYANWITQLTGLVHRLPTDEEWTFAAAEKAWDEAAPLIDPSDPAQAWIARYEIESARSKSLEIAPQAIGAFGTNSQGLKDVAGNVWEWTSTCFVRATLDREPLSVTNVNCGVRVVEGAHRTYMTDFIRDPRKGGCAAGVPPANLGFRLVVETGRPSLRALVGNFIGSLRKS